MRTNGHRAGGAHAGWGRCAECQAPGAVPPGTGRVCAVCQQAIARLRWKQRTRRERRGTSPLLRFARMDQEEVARALGVSGSSVSRAETKFLRLIRGRAEIREALALYLANGGEAQELLASVLRPSAADLARWESELADLHARVAHLRELGAPTRQVEAMVKKCHRMVGKCLGL